MSPCITIIASRDLSQDERNMLRGMFPNDKSLSSHSINYKAGDPKTPRLADYRAPTLIDALDLELPSIWANNISILGHGRVVEILQLSWDNTIYKFCLEIYRNTGNLPMKMRTHTERKYQCSLCLFLFHRKGC